MIALYKFIPMYCPYCGNTTRLERVDNLLSGKFKAHQALSCAICGIMYQFASQIEILRAATASGGDMVDYFVDHEDPSNEGSQN